MKVSISILAVLAFAINVQADDNRVQLDRKNVRSTLSQTGEGHPTMNGILPTAAPANDCTSVYPIGTLPDDGAYGIGGFNTCGQGNDFEAPGDAGCSYGSGGEDEVMSFQVMTSGIWNFWTCGLAYWDTSLMALVDGGAGCPVGQTAIDAQFVGCDGDGCADTTYWESDMYVTMYAGETYYLVLDGYGSSCGAATVAFYMAGILCTSDAMCDDGTYCNGAETCDLASGVCQAGAYPCDESYQICDEATGTCPDPDPCLVWLGGDTEGWTATQDMEVCTMFWKCDDIEMREGGGRELVSFDVHYQARNYWAPNPTTIGTTMAVDVSLFSVHSTTSGNPNGMGPDTMIPGTLCNLTGQITGAGDPPQVMHCDKSGEGIIRPEGDDILTGGADFFVCIRSEMRSGFVIASQNQLVGGLAQDDEFGLPYGAVWYEQDDPAPDCATGVFGSTWFGPDPTALADFSRAQVCTVVVGPCCGVGRGVPGCVMMSAADCAVAGGSYQGDNTLPDPHFCADGDPDADGFYFDCDNCPDVYNDDQADCNDDDQGDACEPEPEQDADGDGCCNDVDECDEDPLKCFEGQCGCGIEDTDSDGDGVANCNDDCPLDINKTEPGCCGCSFADPDMDGDGYPECAPDADVQDIPMCPDTCHNVDDAVYGPCPGDVIPTVSEWGLVIFALLLLAAGKVYFGRRTVKA